MIFNTYWWECESEVDAAIERERQENHRYSLLAAAVKTFFPVVNEIDIFRRIRQGCTGVESFEVDGRAG